MKLSYKLRLIIWLTTTTLGFLILNTNLLPYIGINISGTSSTTKVIPIILSCLVFALMQYVYLLCFEKKSIKWLIVLFLMVLSILLLFILMNVALFPKLVGIFQISFIGGWPFAGYAISTEGSHSGNILISILMGFVLGTIEGGLITLFYSFLKPVKHKPLIGLLLLYIMILLGTTINSVVLSYDLNVNNYINYKFLLKICGAFLGLLYGISTSRFNLSR